MKHLKVDYYLFIILLLIIVVFKAPEYAFILILPVLSISYYRIIIKRDITTVLILMLSARLIMGPFIINNNVSFNILNLVCNYIPILIILFYNFSETKTVNVEKIKSLKWTILFLLFMMLFSFLHISFAITEFAKEILPLLFFLLVIFSNGENKINYTYLLKFFRYTFIASILIYLSPYFYDQMRHLFSGAIIFKEPSYTIALRINRSIPRNTGFVFDFRIMGQLACLYLIILYYLGKTKSYRDVILLSVVAVLTFSRGPLTILVLLLMAVYLPKKIRITKKLLLIVGVLFVLLVSSIIYIINDNNLQKYVATFNPFTEKNVFSQRSAFTNYSLNKFYENPLGNGIGALSSTNANNKIYAGITNLHKEIPDKVFYFKVTDAYLLMSLAEKGVIGFVLMLLSFSELFFHNKNRLSLFFLIAFYLNIIGTDIPKQGFYYFVLIMVYYGLSTNNIKPKTL